MCECMCTHLLMRASEFSPGFLCCSYYCFTSRTPSQSVKAFRYVYTTSPASRFCDQCFQKVAFLQDILESSGRHFTCSPRMTCLSSGHHRSTLGSACTACILGYRMCPGHHWEKQAKTCSGPPVHKHRLQTPYLALQLT